MSTAIPGAVRVAALVLLVGLSALRPASADVEQNPIDEILRTEERAAEASSRTSPTPYLGNTNPARGISSPRQRGSAPLEIDPALRRGIAGYRGLTSHEADEVLRFVADAVTIANEWMRTPAVRDYFRNQYDREPIDVLARSVRIIRITHFADYDHAAQIRYDGTLEIEVHNVLAGLKIGPRAGWIKLAAGSIIHEVVHWAAYAAGKHHDPQKDQDDEGTVAEKKLGIWMQFFPAYRLELHELLRP